MDGILNINKPCNITSYDVIRQIKKVLPQVKKIGHTGTLDPQAKGVLLVCLGEGTKIASYLTSLTKEYIGEMVLGITTQTGDSEGKIIKKIEPVDISGIDIKKSFEKLVGEIKQIPPLFSAVKYKGRKLYNYARRGEEVKPPPRKVTIYNLKLLSYSLPKVKFSLVCSQGTYVRALCEDIGRYLGCGAYLSSLCRTRIGNFKIEKAQSLNKIKVMSEAEIREKIIDLNSALESTPYLKVSSPDASAILRGKGIKDICYILEGPSIIKPKMLLRILDKDNRLLALAEGEERNKILLKRIFN